MAWNFDGSTPIYLQIVNILKGEIAGGAYPPVSWRWRRASTPTQCREPWRNWNGAAS